VSWLGRLFRRGHAEARLDAELRDHVERQVADLVRAGVSEREARRRTALSFGGVDQVKEACRDARGTRWAHELAQDVRYGVRLLRRSPAFTLVLVASLALGIGANTAIFTLVDGLLVRSLPVREPQQLVVLQNDSWTNPIWEQLRDHRATWAQGALAWSDDRFDLANGGEAAPVDGIFASGDFFNVLGVQPVVGRLLLPADDTRGGGPDGPVAAISYRLWQQRYGGAADIVGRPITLKRVPFTIVGVMPPAFLGPTVGRAVDVAVPIATVDLFGEAGGESQLDGRMTWWLRIMARLKPGQTTDDATRALRAIQAQVRAATIPDRAPEDVRNGYLGDGFTLVPAASGVSDLRRQYREPLLTLMAAVALVLLIACANVTNLLLARANARRHEFSARLALGAGRGRLARQLLTESLLLAVPGALLGTWLAAWGSRQLVDQISTPGRPVALDLAVNWRVLAFTAGVAVATSLLFGVLPAWRASRVDPAKAIGPGREIFGDRSHRLSSALVVVQVALSLILVVGAGLFVRTFTTLSSLDFGIEPDRVLTVRVATSKAEDDETSRVELYERIVTAAERVPGVGVAAMSLIPPMSGMGWNNMFSVDDQAPSEQFDRERIAFLNGVTPDFFKAYGTPLRTGRAFDARDRPGAPDVAIVNEAFARRFLKGTPAVGHIVKPNERRPGRPPERWEIVGVVQDAAYRSMRPPFPPTVYRPLAQLPADDVFPNSSLAIRANVDLSAALMKSLVSTVSGVDPTLSLSVLPFDRQVRALMTRERLVAILSASFGGLALLLACVGLYGVTAYAVSRRRTEIGIRMALGASASLVLRLVLGRAVLLVLAGVVIGGGVSLWAARYVGSLLYGLEPRDPATFVGAALVMSAIGVVAAWLPARRAARIDPARVLRDG
jgi:putative ABC transport system permease protein